MRDRWLADLRRRESPTSRDELPFLALVGVALLAVAQLTDPGSAVELALAAPAAVAFVLRGLLPRMPSEVFAIVVLVSVGAAQMHGGNLEGTFFLSVTMVLYVAWHLGSTIRAVSILVAAAALPMITALVVHDDLVWTPWTSASVLLFVLGRNFRRQHLLIEELEAAREALAESAVAAERTRIARELHDLAGHTLAAILLHVAGARHVLRRDVDEAERALIDAESIGRSSLDQIRATVVALRTSERGTDPALAGSADLRAVVEEYRRAGLEITITAPDDLAVLDGPVATALHRITREALANVARHAPTNRVELAVELVDSDDGVSGARLVVDDRGRRPIVTDADSGHFGLVGMRERARALGGDLHAGPSAEGWRVEAWIPVTSIERHPVAAP